MPAPFYKILQSLLTFYEKTSLERFILIFDFIFLVHVMNFQHMSELSTI